MGRIADALKKAERERQETIRLGLGVHAAAPRSAPAVSVPPSRPAGPAPRVAPRPEVKAARPAASSSAPGRDKLDPGLVVAHVRASAISEQYRSLRTWMLAHNSTGEHRIIGVASSVNGEGRTTTTANLGLALSEVRHLSTLVVDCDLHRGNLAGRFGLAAGPGLADVLSGRCGLDDAIAETCVGNLSVLPAGSLDGASATELLNSRLLSRVFDEIRERFHYVLVDTPAVQSAADAGRVGTLCTGVLMVVRLARTASPLVRQSVRWLAANNVHVLGCVAVGADSLAARVPNETHAA